MHPGPPARLHLTTTSASSISYYIYISIDNYICISSIDTLYNDHYSYIYICIDTYMCSGAGHLYKSLFTSTTTYSALRLTNTSASATSYFISAEASTTTYSAPKLTTTSPTAMSTALHILANKFYSPYMHMHCVLMLLSSSCHAKVLLLFLVLLLSILSW